MMSNNGFSGSMEIAWGWNQHPRSGKESDSLNKLKGKFGKFSLSLVSESWRWLCTTSMDFSTFSLRMRMMEADFRGVLGIFDWISWVPLKVNFMSGGFCKIGFLWRLISLRVVNMDYVLFPHCSREVEEVEHVFFNCEFAVMV